VKGIYCHHIYGARSKPSALRAEVDFVRNNICVKFPLDYTQWRTQEIFSGAGGCSTNSDEDRGKRERGSGAGSTLVMGSGGSCNLVQEISFRIVKFS